MQKLAYYQPDWSLDILLASGSQCWMTYISGTYPLTASTQRSNLTLNTLAIYVVWWVCPIMWQQSQSFDMTMSHSCLMYFGYWFSPSPISCSLIGGAGKGGYCLALNNGFSNNLFINHIMDMKLNTEDTLQITRLLAGVENFIVCHFI